MTPLRTSAANCPNHTGLTAQIREVLAQAPEPMSPYQIALATGAKADRVRGAISQMVNRTGSIVSIKTPRGIVYALYVRQVKAKAQPGSGQVAGRIVYPQFVYGASRLG